MASSPQATPSNRLLMSYLPSVFQGPKEEGRLLRDFLAPFAELLFGETGLHSTIVSLADCLDARKAPIEFLPWLASWMGATLYHQLSEAKQREFVANAADYYRYRGTRENLKRLVELVTDFAVQIDEPDFRMFQVGIHYPIDVEIYIEGGPLHAFRVRLKIPTIAGVEDQETRNRNRRIETLVRAVIDFEKPAHTTYELEVSSGSDATDVAAPTPPPTLFA